MAKFELPSSKKGRERLLKLAKLLEEDAKNKKGLKFDMGVWGLVETDENDEPLYKPGLNCHTTACAMGLAALSGKFAKQGLCYEVNSGDVDIWMKGNERDLGDGVKAAEVLFDIDNGTAMWLFSGSASYDEFRLKGKKGELQVAKRIKDYVKGKIKPAFTSYGD